MEKKQYVKPEIVEIDSKIASVAGNDGMEGTSDPNTFPGVD